MISCILRLQFYFGITSSFHSQLPFSEVVQAWTGDFLTFWKRLVFIEADFFDVLGGFDDDILVKGIKKLMSHNNGIALKEQLSFERGSELSDDLSFDISLP